MVSLLRADSPERWTQARSLLEEYRASLDFDLSFQDYQHGMAFLEVEYGAAGGVFLVAQVDGVAIGRVGLRRFTDELK